MRHLAQHVSELSYFQAATAQLDWNARLNQPCLPQKGIVFSNKHVVFIKTGSPFRQNAADLANRSNAVKRFHLNCACVCKCAVH